METLLSTRTASITELKSKTAAIIADDAPSIAILNRSNVVGYFVQPEFFEKLIDMADEINLLRTVNERKNDGQTPIAVDIDDL